MIICQQQFAGSSALTNFFRFALHEFDNKFVLKIILTRPTLSAMQADVSNIIPEGEHSTVLFPSLLHFILETHDFRNYLPYPLCVLVNF